MNHMMYITLLSNIQNNKYTVYNTISLTIFLSISSYQLRPLDVGAKGEEPRLHRNIGSR